MSALMLGQTHTLSLSLRERTHTHTHTVPDQSLVALDNFATRSFMVIHILALDVNI